MIRIKTPKNGMALSTKVYTESGAEITGVKSVIIGELVAGNTISATVEINRAEIDIYAHPLLGLDTLEAAARCHGFKLVPLDAEP